MPADPKPPAATSVYGCTGCAVLVFTVIWSAGTMAGDFMLVRATVRQWRTLGYTTVEGRVTRCEVEEEPSDEGTSYEVIADYTYRVGDEWHTSNRVRHLGLWGGRSARQFAADHPPGSPVTVYYDPANPADAVLIPGPGARELFLLLFLLPFNAAMVALVLGLGRALIFGDPPAREWPQGVQFFEGGDELRVRLVKTTPAAAAFAVLLAGGFFGTFVAAFGAGMPPPAGFMIALWSLILGGAGFAYWRVSRRIASGKAALVIDRSCRTLSLPQSFGRTEPLTMALADVLAVEVLVIETKDEDGHLIRYAPTVRCRDGGEVRDDKLVEWADREPAERLVAWIESRVARRP